MPSLYEYLCRPKPNVIHDFKAYAVEIGDLSKEEYRVLSYLSMQTNVMMAIGGSYCNGGAVKDNNEVMGVSQKDIAVRCGLSRRGVVTAMDALEKYWLIVKHPFRFTKIDGDRRIESNQTPEERLLYAIFGEKISNDLYGYIPSKWYRCNRYTIFFENMASGLLNKIKQEQNIQPLDCMEGVH